MALARLSPSTLKIYLECPRCFWLHINKGIERPRGPFPSLPGGIDLVLKRYFDSYRKQGTLPPLIKEHLSGTLAKQSMNLEMLDEELDAKLIGKLDDCVLLSNGKRAPLDHKTRASAPEDISYTEKYYKFQMDVYTLLLEKAGYDCARVAYVVYYYPKDGELHKGFPFGVLVHEIATDPEGAYDIFKNACNMLKAEIPKSSKDCEFCIWAEAAKKSF